MKEEESFKPTSDYVCPPDQDWKLISEGTEYAVLVLGSQVVLHPRSVDV